MKVVELTSKKDDPRPMLETLDSMREEVLEGKIIAFVAVAIEPDDEMSMWTARTLGGSVTRLRMMGAIAHMQHRYHADELSEKT